jgi:outer membrane protein assembly factor BamB
MILERCTTTAGGALTVADLRKESAMNPITIVLTGALIVTVVGLFAVRAGLRGLRQAAGAWRSRALVIVGIGLIGMAGMAAWRYRVTVEQFFESDYQADSQRLDELKQANLASADPQPQSSGDWSQWRGPQRDGRSAETGLLTTWPAGGPRVLWRKPIKGGYSSIAVVGGRAYTQDCDGTQERVVCLDAATGAELWVHRYDFDAALLDGPNRFAAGPRATPTVHDGRVYTVGATGRMHCLEANPANGQPRVFWQHDLLREFNASIPQWGVACSPLVEGNRVIVQPGGSDGSIAAFDCTTGDLMWKALSDPSGYSSPIAATAAGTRQIVCFTGKGVAGLRPDDGGQLWYFPWHTEFDCNVATPLVAGDYVFISSDYQAGCALLQLIPSGDGITAERVYVRRNKLMRNQFSTCVLSNGYLYGFDVSGHGSTGFLKCVDLRTAEEKWMTRDIREKGCLLYADGHLLVFSQDGLLSLVEATPERFNRKGEVQIFEGSECWALPALADGRLYLRGPGEIVCLDLRK